MEINLPVRNFFAGQIWCNCKLYFLFFALPLPKRARERLSLGLAVGTPNQARPGILPALDM